MQAQRLKEISEESGHSSENEEQRRPVSGHSSANGNARSGYQSNRSQGFEGSGDAQLSGTQSARLPQQDATKTQRKGSLMPTFSTGFGKSAAAKQSAPAQQQQPVAAHQIAADTLFSGHPQIISKNQLSESDSDSDDEQSSR